MAGLDAVETGNELIQPKFEFKALAWLIPLLELGWFTKRKNYELQFPQMNSFTHESCIYPWYGGDINKEPDRFSCSLASFLNSHIGLISISLLRKFDRICLQNYWQPRPIRPRLPVGWDAVSWSWYGEIAAPPPLWLQYSTMESSSSTYFYGWGLQTSDYPPNNYYLSKDPTKSGGVSARNG